MYKLILAYLETSFTFPIFPTNKQTLPIQHHSLVNYLKKRMFLGNGTPNSSLTATIPSFKVMLLMTLFGKYLVYCNDSVLSHTTSSQIFFPLASRMGLEQKSSSQSVMVAGSDSGSRYLSSAVGSSSSWRTAWGASFWVLSDTEWVRKLMTLGWLWKGRVVHGIVMGLDAEVSLESLKVGVLILVGLKLRVAMAVSDRALCVVVKVVILPHVFLKPTMMLFGYCGPSDTVGLWVLWALGYCGPLGNGSFISGLDFSFSTP